VIWHFLEVWGLLLVAFALGGALGTLLYMGLAVSPLANAQIAAADAIADGMDSLRDMFGRRRDTGLYREQRGTPAYVMPLPIPAAPPYAGEDAEAAEDEAVAAHWPEPEALAPPVEELPAAAVAQEYWEDDEWAAAEDDSRWPDDHYWAEDEAPAAPAQPVAALPAAPGMPVAADAGDEHASEPVLAAEEPYDEDEGPADEAEVVESEAAPEADDISPPADAPPAADDPVPMVGPEPMMSHAEAAPDDDSDVIPADALAEPEAITATDDIAPPEGLVAPASKTLPDAEPEPSSPTATVADDVDSGAPAMSGPLQPPPADAVNEPEPESPPVAALPAASVGEIGGDDEPAPEVRAEASVVPPIPAPSEAPGRIPPRRATAPKVEAAPDPALPSTRPLALAGPRNGVPDNLQRIRGVGHKNEELLNSLGIYHFGQIAAWTPAEARWVASQLAFPERLERDDWLGQAMVFATGGDTGYVKAPERRRKGEDDTTVAA